MIVNTFVIAVGVKSAENFAGQIKNKTVKVIGDAVSPRKALDAIYEGYRAGMEI